MLKRAEKEGGHVSLRTDLELYLNNRILIFPLHSLMTYLNLLGFQSGSINI